METRESASSSTIPRGPQRPGVPSTTSRDLRQKIELVLPILAAAGGTLLTHRRIADLYPEYLFTSHCIVRASVPLMEAALGRARALVDDDQVSAELASYLEQHIGEELRHDEWLLSDLQSLGRDRSWVLTRPPSPTVASLVGAQYYWIFHCHPVALLGYIALLEGNPPTMTQIDDLRARTGYAREAFQTLIKHAELDPGHRDELDRTLDALRLTAEQSVVLGLSAMHSTHMLARAMKEIVEREPDA